MFSDDKMLVDGGMIDSIEMLSVILRLEDELGVEVPDSDLTPANFGSVDRMVAYFEVRNAEHP
jgi:acyl carrier protein